MSDSTELLVLRLGMVAVIFVFLAAAAVALQRGMSPARARAVRGAGQFSGPRLVLFNAARSGFETGAAFALPGATTLGRDATNGIVLGDPSVSGTHAVIERDGARWVVRDLGSTNGTQVDGHPVDGRGRVIEDGGTVTVGVVTLRFRAR